MAQSVPNLAQLKESWKQRNVRLGAVLAAALVIAIVIWLAVNSGGGGGSPAEGEPRLVSAEELREAGEERSTPIYWAGSQPGSELELTETEAGSRVYVRYLTGNAEAGDPRPQFLTVGTYAFPHAAAALRRQSRAPGGVLASAPGGAVVFFSRSRPQSVYLAYPGVEAEIEVYDPNPARSLNLVRSGQIVPAG